MQFTTSVLAASALAVGSAIAESSPPAYGSEAPPVYGSEPAYPAPSSEAAPVSSSYAAPVSSSYAAPASSSYAAPASSSAGGWYGSSSAPAVYGSSSASAVYGSSSSAVYGSSASGVWGSSASGVYGSSSASAVYGSSSGSAVYGSSSSYVYYPSSSGSAIYPSSSGTGYSYSSWAHPTGYSSVSSAGPQPPYPSHPGGGWPGYPGGSWPGHPGGSWPGHPGSPSSPGSPSGPGGEYPGGEYPGAPPSGPVGGECPPPPACPTVSAPAPTETGFCLTDDQAEQAADIFRELIQNYSDELALAALAEDFTDYSSAVAIIINGGDGEPLDIEKPLFVGRQAFMDAQGSQPEIPFKKLQRFHGCDSVSMRWLTRRSANGQETETARIPVVGNVLIQVVPSSPGDEYAFRIQTIFSEFNSAAWLVNLGVFVPENGTEGDAGNKRSMVDLRGPMF